MVAVKNDLLQDPMEHLQCALIERNWPPLQWARHVDGAAAELERAMRDHITGAEAPNGVLTTLESTKQQTVATLGRHVCDLRREHVELIDGVGELHWKTQALIHHLRSPQPPQAEGAEISLLRQSGEELLNKLRHHREANKG